MTEELEIDDFVDDVEEQPPKITPASPKWEDYVMSQFLKYELVDGKYPTVNGLRRVCEVVLGPIVGGKVRIVQAPNEQTKCAVAEYEVTVECYNLDSGCVCRTFSSAADAHFGNTDQLFRQYLTAMAETRAEARALRKALKLKQVASDEISDVAKLDTDLASDVQMRAIEKVIRRKNIDLENLAKENSYEIADGKLVISSEEAKKLIARLNKD